MREIWRVENERGQGPYANSTDGSGLAFEEAMRELDVNHDLYHRHPTCRADYIANGHYGFHNRAALDHWFDYFGDYGYDVLREHGMSIHVYSIESKFVEDHDRQLIFDPLQAHWVREEEFSTCTRTTKVG